MNSFISFYEFTQLSQQEQYYLVFTQGAIIGINETDKSKFILYKLYNFFVEVLYNTLDNKIIGLTSFLNSKSN
ncbi:hypothetical protein SDC9_00473 [bioreactor metagenome]|uniref:Uncharacterized protein n=1 Tax=bioreactor metagenome TaxID=1076179 RepID=A0A644SK06_9ZZZZ